MAQGSGFTGKRCLLTGAASGIGRATALKLAAQGAELFLTDRNAEGLAETVADARALGAVVPAHRALDIADYEQVAAFAADIHAAHPSMDVVMNIAGVSAWGTVSHLSHRHWEQMVSVNLMGPIHVIETFVPPMVAAGHGGHLVNVSSAAGLVALPWHAAYSASKYGLRGLSEVLRFDLARHGIGVSVVVPGAVKTPLVQTVEIVGVDREHPQVMQVDRPVQRPCRLAGIGGGQHPSRRIPQPLPDLHLPRHPRAVCVQADRVVALQRGDAAGQRHLHPRAASVEDGLSVSACPSPTAARSGWSGR